ncbi:unnamed protein product, partial [marine sediment metagenome]
MDMTITTILAFAVVCALVYMFFGNSLREAAARRVARREQFGEQYDRFKDTDNNPFIPDFIEKNPRRATIYGIVAFILFITAVDCIHSVPPGHRGVMITFGKVKEVNLGEGLQFKLPYIQKIVNMKVMLEKEQVDENAASSDLQEITTTLT